jgi:hypothetical protein
MIYSFSNTTSYSTFYAFFSSFRITLWPMWLANSKLQPCFYPPQSHAQELTKKKTDKPDRKPVLCQRTFSAVFLHSSTAQFNSECMGPFRMCLLSVVYATGILMLLGPLTWTFRQTHNWKHTNNGSTNFIRNLSHSKKNPERYTGLFKMFAGVLTTCHTQYTCDRSICILYLIEKHSKFLLRTLLTYLLHGAESFLRS